MILEQEAGWTTSRRVRAAFAALAIAILPFAPAGGQSSAAKSDDTTVTISIDDPSDPAAEPRFVSWVHSAPPPVAECDELAKEIAGLKRLIARLAKHGHADEAALLGRVVKRLGAIAAHGTTASSPAELQPWSALLHAAGGANHPVPPHDAATRSAHSALFGAVHDQLASHSRDSVLHEFIRHVAAGAAPKPPVERPGIDARLEAIEERLKQTLRALEEMKQEAQKPPEEAGAWLQLQPRIAVGSDARHYPHVEIEGTLRAFDRARPDAISLPPSDDGVGSGPALPPHPGHHGSETGPPPSGR